MPVQPLRYNVAPPALFDQAIRIDNRARLGGIMDRGQEGAPGLLPHCIDVYLSGFEAVYYSNSFLVV